MLIRKLRWRLTRQGKHLFCEKPLALSLADSREMLEGAEEAGIKHMVGFNYRFSPAVRLAKDLIESGRLGKIYHFRAFFLQDWILDPNFPLVWRLQKEVAGSGSHGDLGAHLIDLARFLVGEFQEVIGMSETFIKERPLASEMTGLSAKGSSSADAPKGEVTVDDATLFLARFAGERWEVSKRRDSRPDIAVRTRLRLTAVWAVYALTLNA